MKGITVNKHLIRVRVKSLSTPKKSDDTKSWQGLSPEWPSHLIWWFKSQKKKHLVGCHFFIWCRLDSIWAQGPLQGFIELCCWAAGWHHKPNKWCPERKELRFRKDTVSWCQHVGCQLFFMGFQLFNCWNAVAKMKLARWLIFKVFIIQTPNIQFPCCFPRKKDTESDSLWTNKRKTNNNTGPQPEIKKKQLKCFTALLPRKPRGILWIPTCWDVYSSCTSPLNTRSQRWSAFGSAPCKKGAANGRMVPPQVHSEMCGVWNPSV